MFGRKKVVHAVDRVIHMKHASRRCGLFSVCKCGQTHPIVAGRVRIDYDAKGGRV